MEYILVDMDGTLSDAAHRLHYIEKKPKNWRAFFRDGALDAPIEGVRTLVLDNARIGRKVVIFTARPEDNREITETWLKENDIPFDRIMMRKKNDFRPDYVVKHEMLLEAVCIYGETPMFAIDDKDEVLEMFEDNFVKTIDAKLFRKETVECEE